MKEWRYIIERRLDQFLWNWSTLYRDWRIQKTLKELPCAPRLHRLQVDPDARPKLALTAAHSFGGEQIALTMSGLMVFQFPSREMRNKFAAMWRKL